MKKEVTALFILAALAILMAFPAAAQDEAEEAILEEEIVAEESAGVTPDSPLYVLDKIVDNVQLAMADGDDKTRKALEIKEERLAEASVMVDKKKPDQAKSALELATKAAEQAQKELDPELEKETNEKVRRAAKLLSGLQERLPDEGWEGVEKAIDSQLSEEEKVRVALLVSKSRLSYCDAIARQDFDLMKGDDLCQVEKSPQWLRERVEGEFKAREDNARSLILDTVGQCIVDPKKCDCSQIPVGKHSQSCEEKKALAIRCEYENDDKACGELSSEKLEDFLPEFVGEEGKQTLLSHIREKEGQMFERFKPPECEAASTFEDCFKIMKDLYGEPIQCEGLSEDECMEFVKTHPPTEKPNLPPECEEAGMTKPVECAELMFSKYGTPPQCEGLDTRECMKLMRHERPDAANFGMPPECQEAGAKEPRQCFDIMTAKFGTPPECEGLSSDDCFREMMKRGPGEGPPQGGGGQEEQPECKEKGLKGKDCFLLMTELYGGLPQQCEGLSTDECFEKVTKEGPPEGEPPVRCVGLSPEECRAKIQEHQGLPPECAQNPENCRDAFAGRGVPGGIPAECAGLEPEQCDLVMMQKFGPPECKEATKDECEAIMKEKYGSEGGFGGSPGGEGGFGSGGFGGGAGFKNECEGLAREECDQKMFERFKPPECEGLSNEECRKNMNERFERERREQDENHRECEGLSEEECRQRPGERLREPGQEGTPGGMPANCRGLTDEECRSKFFEGRGEGEARGEGEHREFPPGFEKPPEGERREGGPQRNFREPLGAPIGRGAPSGCEGLSPEDCGRQMQEKFGQPPQGGQPNEGFGTMPPERGFTEGRNDYPKNGEYPRDYPQQQPPQGDYPRGDSGGYPSPGQYPSGGGSPSPDGERSGGDSGSSGSEGGNRDSGSGEGGSNDGGGPSSGGGGGGDGSSPPEGITGQIVGIVKWIGGQ